MWFATKIQTIAGGCMLQPFVRQGDLWVVVWQKAATSQAVRLHPMQHAVALGVVFLLCNLCNAWVLKRWAIKLMAMMAAGAPEGI